MGNKRSAKDQATVEMTINMRTSMYRQTFRTRAPRSVKIIRKKAAQTMGTNDVRIDAKLNKFLWSRGIRKVPGRVRVRMERKRSEEEDANEKMYTLVTYVPCPEFKGLQTLRIQEDEE